MRFLKNKIAKAQGIAIRQSMSPSEDLLVKYEENPVKTEESIQTKSTTDQDVIKTEDDEYSFSDNRLKQSQSVFVKMEKIEEMYNSSENMVLRSSSVPVNHSYNSDLDYVQNSSFIAENQIIISNQESSIKKPVGRKPIKNKNFIKNVDLTFIKAILAFANSHLSLPYVKNLLQQENIKFTEFTSFIGQCQERASNGLQAFRQILIIDETTDDDKMISLKRIFKALSEIFILEHSLNWISQSRLTYKEEYVNYRLKMLQKIQNPVQYLNSKEKK